MDIYANEKISQKNKVRSKRALFVMTFLILILIARIWYLQIFQGRQLRNFSDKNTIKEQTVQAPRGNFLDRNGNVLIANRPGYRLSLDPVLFRRHNKEELKKVILDISKVLDQDAKFLEEEAIKNYRKMGSYNPGVVAKEISFDQAFRLKELRLQHPEILVENVIFREYPLKKSGAQVFGYVSLASKDQILTMRSKGVKAELGDQVGQIGLEKSLDSYVRGENGISYVQVDAKGRIQTAANTLISYIGLRNVEPKIGNNIILTLDTDLQKAAFDAFQRADKLGERTGGLVALNIKGEVLAWASNPSYDPGLFQTGISSKDWEKLNTDKHKPLTDKVAQGTYSPGSVFKPFVGLAALHLNEITKYSRVESPGYISFGGRRYHDSRASGHGVVNLSEAIEVSGNVFFYKLGIALGVDALHDVISRLGIGQNTGIDFVQESKGLLPNSKWKEENRGEPWQKGEDLSFAIGQGAILTTLLQLARGYLTIATKGKVYKPLLVKEIQNSQGKAIKTFEPTLIEDLSLKGSMGIKRSDFDSVIEGLIKVAHGEKGTARYRSSRKFLMAGKTGTVQVRSFSSDEIYIKCEQRPESERHHGVFVGFAPAEKPEIVVAGLALHACHGSSGAAPMVTELLTTYMKKHHPELFEREAANGI